MEKLKISKEKILFVLLFLWMAMPIFQTIRKIYSFIDLVDCYFALMKIIGVVGIGLSIITIFIKIKDSDNKKQTLKKLIPIFLFVLYMIWTYISCKLATNTYRTFKGSMYRREGYYMYLNYAGYFLCAFLIDSPKLKKVLLNTFVISAVFLIVISRLSLLGQPFTNIFVNNSVETTVFAQFNHYCYFLMMAVMCSLGLFFTEKNKILKIIYFIAYLITIYAMIYNDTFGCYLAVAVTLILYGIYTLIKKKDRLAILATILVFVIFSFAITKDGRNVVAVNVENFLIDLKAIILQTTGIGVEESGKEDWQIRDEFMQAGTNRGALWKGAIGFIQKNPIIGYGADNLAEQYNNAWMWGSDRPHNLILYLACVSGIPGALLYLTAVAIIVIIGIKKLFKNNGDEKIYLLIVVAYLISAMFANSMYYTSPFFFIFLGSLMKCNFNIEKGEKCKNLQNL